MTGHKKDETAQPSASLYIYMPCCSNDKQHKEVLGADENRTDRNSHPHVGFNEMFNNFCKCTIHVSLEEWYLQFLEGIMRFPLHSNR